MRILYGDRCVADHARKGTRPGQPWRIEGLYYTVAQIAERLGVGRHAAGERLRAAQAEPGPVTWDKLRRPGDGSPYP